jgi:hypothetical protein
MVRIARWVITGSIQRCAAAGPPAISRRVPGTGLLGSAWSTSSGRGSRRYRVPVEFSIDRRPRPRRRERLRGRIRPKDARRIRRALYKEFVQAALNEALKWATALRKLDAPTRLVLLHDAPIPETLAGEPEQIYPFLGSSRLLAPIETYGADAVFHGHAHIGSPSGRTPSGIPVFNVAAMLLDRRPGGRSGSGPSIRPRGDAGGTKHRRADRPLGQPAYRAGSYPSPSRNPRSVDHAAPDPPAPFSCARRTASPSSPRPPAH